MPSCGQSTAAQEQDLVRIVEETGSVGDEDERCPAAMTFTQRFDGALLAWGVKRRRRLVENDRRDGHPEQARELARLGANKLWKYLGEKPFVNALGALTGNQAMQQVKAGLNAIYLSGWQVAADANVAGEMYPDQSLYPANSVPLVVKRINNTLLRADQLHHAEGNDSIDFLQPIVADAEAGFGGVLNAFELMKAMIEAGAAGVHFEDQLASVKKCGHMGGKVLVPTQEAVQKLIAARLAADVSNVPTLVIARTDAEAADLLTSDVDPNDAPFCTGERTVEGFYKTRPGIDQAISRGLAYAPYADLVWCETGKPDLAFAKAFAEAIRERAEVLDCYTTMGEWDFMLRIVTKDIKAYEAFYLDHLSKLPYVQSINSSVTVTVIKETTVLPIID